MYSVIRQIIQQFFLINSDTAAGTKKEIKHKKSCKTFVLQDFCARSGTRTRTAAMAKGF